MNRFGSLLLYLAIATLVLGITNCGGGGGGGSSSSSDGRNDRYGVRVVHGAIEGTPVEYVKPESLDSLSQVRFLGDSFYSSAPEGPLLLRLFTANSGASDLLVSAAVNVAAKSRYTVLLYGDQTDLGLRSAVFTDAIPEIGDASSALRILNGVDGAGSIRVTVTGVALPQALAFGAGGNYLTVPAGLVSFTAARGSDGLVLTSGTIAAEAGVAYTLVIAGEAGIFVSSKVHQDN